MGERRFGGDIRIRSPPRVASQGDRDCSPQRRQSRDLQTLSPIGASMKGRDYSRDLTGDCLPQRGQSRDVQKLSPTRATMKVGDYSRDLRTGSPPRVRMQSRDYWRTNRRSRERHSHLSSEMEKWSHYGWHLDEDRDRQSQTLSQFNDGLPQRDSPSTKFQWRHLLEKSERTNDYANDSSKRYPVSSTRVTTERSYQSSGLAAMGRTGTRVEKFMPMEVERDRTSPASYPLDGGARRSYEIDGGLRLSQSQKLNMGLQKNEDLRFQDQMPADKLPARDTSRYVIPSSQSKASSIVPLGGLMEDFHDSHNDGFPVHSDRFNRSSGIPTEPIPRKAHTHISHLKSSRDSIFEFDDMTKHRNVHLSPNDGSRGGYTYPEVRKSEKSGMPSLSDEPYHKLGSLEDDFGLLDSFGSRIMKPIKDRIVFTEGSRREHMTEGPLWDHYHSSQEQQISNYLDSVGSLYASKKDGEALGDISMHHEYEREVFGDHGNTNMREDHGSGRDSCLQLEDEVLNMLLMKEDDQGLDGIGSTYQEAFSEEELDLVEQPKRMVKQKHDVEKELTIRSPRSRFSSENKIHHDTSSGLLMNASRYRNVGRTINDIGRRNSNFVANGGPSVPILKSNVGDIKKRLGCSVRDIKKRLGPLRPVPQHIHIAHPLVKKRKVQKSRRDQGGCHGIIHGEEEGPLEGGLQLAKSEPREQSEEFKQLVHSAFLKFVKQLNDNPVQRRRLKGQGKVGSLMCGVCGSNSEEFLDTKSLALHAYTAPKVGMRAQHFGFHKAVCFLMGWKSAEMMNSQWVCQLLPDAETVALKEDLIIWPPVVVIHNSSIRNINPDGRVIVPGEMLEGILRDMGLAEKNKVRHGKPANQSIMVVKFSGTLSGFQDALKLHKIYADNKHGRNEFQRINPNDTQKASASKVEEFLYGYLGIAEDLDKLDFDTKKRSFVRSKKEIQEIADAPLKTERV